jgi:hypothetical protein
MKINFEFFKGKSFILSYLKKVELGKKESIFLLLFYGEGPIVRRPISPKAHLSDNPLVRRPICPTTH